MAAPRLLHTEEAAVRSHLRLQRRRSEENLKQPPAAELYAARIASSADELSSLNRSPSVSSSDESYSRTDFSRTDADSPSPPPPRAPSFTEQLRLLSLPGAEAPPPALAELSSFADRDDRSEGEVPVTVEAAARRVAETGAAPARTDSESDGLDAFDEPETTRSSDGEPPCKKRSLSREEGAAMNRLLARGSVSPLEAAREAAREANRSAAEAAMAAAAPGRRAPRSAPTSAKKSQLPRFVGCRASPSGGGRYGTAGSDGEPAPGNPPVAARANLSEPTTPQGRCNTDTYTRPARGGPAQPLEALQAAARRQQEALLASLAGGDGGGARLLLRPPPSRIPLPAPRAAAPAAPSR